MPNSNTDPSPEVALGRSNSTGPGKYAKPHARPRKMSLNLEAKDVPSSRPTTEMLPNDLTQTLRSHSFFANASNAFIHELSTAMHVRAYQPGDMIIKEGERGKTMFFIIKGAVNVISEELETILSEIHAGLFFGELSMLFGIPRTATVVAKAKCVLVSLTAEQLQDTLNHHKDMREHVRREARSRVKILLTRGKDIPDFVFERLALTEDEDMSEQKNLMNMTDEAHRSPKSETMAETFDSMTDYTTSFSTSIPQEPMDMSEIITTGPLSRDQRAKQEDAFDPPSHQSMPDTAPKSSRFTDIINQQPRRRRASIAVWSDTRLSQIANSKSDGPKREQSHRRECTTFGQMEEVAEKEEGHETDVFFGLNEKCLAHIFSFLFITDLITIRRVSKAWSHAANSDSLCRRIDLSSIHKKVDDDVLNRILSFVGDRVKYLGLRNCWNLSNEGIRSIPDYAPHVQRLDLHSCWEVTQYGVASLTAECKSLRSLDLSNCRKIDDECIDAIVSNNDSIVDLAFSYCKVLTDRTMASIVKKCPNLHKLNLQRCTGISDNGFKELNGAIMDQLVTLNISDCSFLTDASIASVAKSCPNLRSINMSFCCGLTDSSIDVLTQNCPHIRSIDLSFCGSAVSDASVHWIASRLGCIERLSFRGCIRIGEQSIVSLASHAKSLRVLNVSSCKNIPGIVIQGLPKRWVLLDNTPLDSYEDTGRVRRFTY